jgi:hypothetical protein
VSTPTRRQAALLVVGLLVVASAVAAASFLVKPSRARAFDLFYGSILLNDDRAPVAVDLASGKPTVRLLAADTQVSISGTGQLEVVPLEGGTLLLNSVTGEFNMVDSTGFVIKTKDGGVPLPRQSGSTKAIGIASGAMAYVVQVGSAHTGVYLVSQSTVATAIGVRAKVKPRAYATMDQRGSTAAGANASANSDLWMLVGSGSSRTVRQLVLPKGSNAGVGLTQRDHGTVSAAAAIGVATVNADGTGGQAVGVADSRGVRVFEPSGGSTTVPVPGLTGVKRVLAATGQQGSLSFLYHSSTGWKLVTVDADGSGPATVHALPQLGVAAALAAPAASRGALYTMNTGKSGAIWRISAAGAVARVSGAKSYPLANTASGTHVETSDFTDAYVLSRGARVIFNSRSHARALTLFTDGSHAPVIVDKGAAVDLSASGTAAEITDQHKTQTPSQTNRPTPTTTPNPAQPVNNHINCKTATQVPHIPTVQLVQRASRSVQLSWTYPTLDPQDCIPSTYAVSVKRLSADGPQPPGKVTVQGQNGVNLSGLFPNTEYQIVVTAYINGNGTDSAPLDVRTSVEGPAAPTNVRTTVDDSGNWTITWNSCGGRDEGCIPSANWTIIPAFCDGQGLSSPPQSVTIIGDPTQHSFTYTFQGNNGLLGRGLSFQVEGIGTTGTPGTASKAGACTYSWAHPNASAMSLTGGLADTSVASGATTSATVTLHFSGNQAAAAGGVGAQFTYQLLLDGNVVQTKKPTTATTATFDDIQPGKDYSAQVSVAPPKHKEAAVTVGPVSVGHTTSAWPQLAVNANFTNTDDVSGTLNITITGVSSARSDGETFALADSQLVCGNSAVNLTKSAFDPAAGPLSFQNIARTDFNGNCAVTVHLQEAQQSGTLLYGGAESPAASDGVTIQPPALAANFAASWDANSPNTVDVTFSGSSTINLAHDWKMTLVSPSKNACGSSSTGPQATIVSSCPNETGSDGWQVAISYTYFGTLEGPTKIDVKGSQAWPTVDAGDFSTSWTGGPNDYGIQLSYSGPKNLGPGHWTETASNPDNADCGTVHWDPTSSPSQNISLASNCTTFSDVPVTVTITNDQNPRQQPVALTVAVGDHTNLQCDPSKITAVWDSTTGPPSEPLVNLTPDNGEIGGCSNWTLTLRQNVLLGPSCSPVGPSDSLPPSVTPSGCSPLSGSENWVIDVKYQDKTMSGTPTNSVTIPVDGNVP